MCNLGFLYDRGFGVEADDAHAFQLYSQAAARGLPQCLFNLAIFYRDGRGTPRNDAAAYVWFSLAARADVTAADVKAKQMRAGLTPAQIAAADREIELRRAQW